MSCGGSCFILILLGYREARIIQGSKRIKIIRLIQSLRKLSTSTDCLDCRKIEKVVASYDIGPERKKARVRNLTVNDVFELVVLLQDNNGRSDIHAQALSWVLKCQSSGGGFGVWPGSSPRLSSTYQALSILKDHDLLTECDADTHALWVKTLQRPDGFFRGPWSKRPVWEDTFHAVKSLDMLGVTLDNEQVNSYQKSCSKTLVQKGLNKDNAGVIYHCLGALESLGTIPEDIRNGVSGWVSAKIEQLLLTNIALNYEEVHFALMTYHLISEHVNISTNSLDLLAERLQTALDAELTCIHI